MLWSSGQRAHVPRDHQLHRETHVLHVFLMSPPPNGLQNFSGARSIPTHASMDQLKKLVPQMLLSNGRGADS